MAISLTTSFQKVLEASTKVTSNVTGYLRLYLKYGGRDEANNEDTIYYEIRQYAHNPYGNYLAWEWTNALAWNIKLGTTTKASGTYTQTPAIYSDGNERVKASGSWVQPHNDDGTWSSSISFEGYVYQTKVTDSDTITLPNIARASSIAVSNGNIGSNVSISIAFASSSFTHTLTYEYGSLTGTIATKTTNKNVTWKLPTTFYAQTPKRSLSGTVYCKTYSGNTQIGETTSDTFTAYVDESTNQPTLPTPTIEVTDGTSTTLTGSTTKVISGYSDVKTVIEPKYYNSATMKEYRVVMGNQTKNTTTSQFYDVTTNIINVYVKDSREFTLEGDYPYVINKLTLLDYSKPKITSINIRRTEQTSTEVIATLKGTYWNKTFGSTTNVSSIRYSWRYKLSTSTTWNSWSSWATPTISSANFSITDLSLGTSFATNGSYDFQFRIKDALGNADASQIVTSTTQNVTISTPIVEIYEDAVNVNGNITMNNGLLPYISQNVPTITNCNDLELKSGFYWADRTATGVPSSSNAWFIQQIRATGYITQIAYKIGSDGIYYRTYGFDSGGWYAWTPMIFGRNLAQSRTTNDSVPYSAKYINNMFDVKKMWSGDVVASSINSWAGTAFTSDYKPYDCAITYFKFDIDGNCVLIPLRATSFGETITYFGQWIASSSTFAYIRVQFNGYSYISFMVSEISGRTVSQVHLREVIGIGNNI